MYSCILSHQTAIDVYRYKRAIHEKLAPQTKIKKSDTEIVRRSLINFLNLPDAVNRHEKIHLTVLAKNRYRELSNMIVHYYNRTLPENSFCKYNNEILVSSPEFLFCQLANSVTFPQLLLYGFEICGTYSMPLDNNSSAIANCQPITNIKKLKSFAKNLKRRYDKFPWINIALEALKIIEDKSASPQESRIFIMLTAPRKFGGYGISNLTLNNQIDLSEKAKSIAGQNIITPDICSLKHKIAIEYDSNMYHRNDAQFNRDKQRADAMQHDGWKVYSLVKNQVYDINVFHNIAQDILVDNKQDKRIRRKQFYLLRDQLYKDLFFSRTSNLIRKF